MSVCNRRIAQRESVSKHTEKAAVFESCSAYQPSSNEVLFLSHCVPNPPDKGERIRARHELAWLAERYRVHLVCFARTSDEADRALELRDRCASVHVERLSPAVALAKAAARFACGGCLTTSYYHAPAARAHISSILEQHGLGATFCYSSAVAHLAPARVPMILDYVDADSQKWFDYSRTRWPAWAYALEGRRLRRVEQHLAWRAWHSFFSTEYEKALLERLTPSDRTGAIENGVDFDYFDPSRDYSHPASGRHFLVFTGAMNYYPNAQGILSFADRVYPELRRAAPQLELFVVGRNPTREVRRLAARPGITVTGEVPDVRPYLAAASAVVVPLEIARGIQNKVLEALAMGKRVMCSPAVRATFGDQEPKGLAICPDPRDYLREYLRYSGAEWDPEIRLAARQRFSWSTNLSRLSELFETALSLEKEHALRVRR